VLNFLGYIEVPSPQIPILGQLRLSIIYPLAIPLIIAILTNTVNMLEGYNGEGSGTVGVALIFITVCALLLQSAQGFFFGIICLGAVLAFFLLNRFPDKVFPGDVGTLTMGAMLGVVGILGGLEVVMFCTILAHVFNSFYVLASVRGFKESHSIKKKDIYIDEQDYIYASNESGAPMTLPRLLLAHGRLKEDVLVGHFIALSVICGSFALVAEVARLWTLDYIPPLSALSIVALITAGGIFFCVLKKYRRLTGISVIMILLLGGGIIFLALVDRYLMDSPLNWLIAGVLAMLGFGAWYLISVRYFWRTIARMPLYAAPGAENNP
jgi:UDP-N-acetylmuramyl pentapeptide phosphotransferase/UDP-N-acetylglucosamine-1-phosphate transferase